MISAVSGVCYSNSTVQTKNNNGLNLNLANGTDNRLRSDVFQKEDKKNNVSPSFGTTLSKDTETVLKLYEQALIDSGFYAPNTARNFKNYHRRVLLDPKEEEYEKKSIIRQLWDIVTGKTQITEYVG